MADRHGGLLTLLRTLKLPAMAAAFPDLALKAAKAGRTHEAFLYDLVQCECVQRDERRIARLLHRSGPPQEKTFATLARDRFPLAVRQQIERLQSGAFVEEAGNVIAVGRPGTGKSHLAAALGHALVVQGQPVRWSTTAQLVQPLLAAKRDLRLPQPLAQLDRFTCLMLDDIGSVPHNRDEMEALFTLLAERDERRSVVITTNLVFSGWRRIFKDPMTTMAAIDRVVHHAVILDLRGLESYRVQAANAQQGQRTSATTARSAGQEEG